MRIVALLMLVLLTCMVVGDARMPEVGDQVFIVTSVSATVLEYGGSITNLSDSMVCLNCTSVRSGLNPTELDPLINFPRGKMVCIGVGQMAVLYYSPQPSVGVFKSSSAQ